MAASHQGRYSDRPQNEGRHAPPPCIIPSVAQAHNEPSVIHGAENRQPKYRPLERNRIPMWRRLSRERERNREQGVGCTDRRGNRGGTRRNREGSERKGTDITVTPESLSRHPPYRYLFDASRPWEFLSLCYKLGKRRPNYCTSGGRNGTDVSIPTST